MALLESNAATPFQPSTSTQLPQSPCKDQTKQGSIFSLTLDEIQLKSGKSVGMMNMDEFLANLWSNVDENQQLPAQETPNTDTQSTLVRQGSFSIPSMLCKKTVDQVWDEIHKDLPEHRRDNVGHLEPPQRQLTFGEITLEDFLVKAGVVQESSPLENNNNVKSQTLEAHFGLVGPTLGLGLNMGNTLATSGYVATYPLFHNNATMVQASNDHNENGKDMIDKLLDSGGSSSKRRIIDGPPEVVVERRQRRMIKNRESAARSRARKQAYTVELEFELNQLKVENTKLKQLLEENEQRRKQEVLKKKVLTPVLNKVEKLKKLRRTTSMEW